MQPWPCWAFWLGRAGFAKPVQAPLTGVQSENTGRWYGSSIQRRGTQSLTLRACMTASIQASGVSRGIGNLNTALRTLALDHGPSGATAVAYSADDRILSVGHDAAARVWSADGKKICESAGLVGSAFRVAFSHDGKHAFAGDWSGTVREFAADTGARLLDLSQIVR